MLIRINIIASEQGCEKHASCYNTSEDMWWYITIATNLSNKVLIPKQLKK